LADFLSHAQLAWVDINRGSCPVVEINMKHELRVMLSQGSGSIVSVSSAYGSVAAAGASPLANDFPVAVDS
jgi:hypothetical protein